jgi:thioredoxin-like negative regulator of GroEL
MSIRIIKYYMDGCSPCKALDQQLANLKTLHPIVSIDAMSLTAAERDELEIKSVPHTLIEKDGVFVHTFRGVKSTKQLKELLESL